VKHSHTVLLAKTSSLEVECYDPRGAYIGLNVYDMTPRGGMYGDKCTCNL
jgi:hypothetical protein